MALSVTAATRFARQLALPEIGPAGQERLGAARVAIVGGGLAAETAARYLAAAGVGALRLLGGPARDAWDAALRGSNPDVALEHDDRPEDGAAWLASLSDVDLVVRDGFDDDAMLSAAIRLGVPAIVLRAHLDGHTEGADVVSFRKHGPCPHTPLDVPSRVATSGGDGPAAVVAGALAAAEALHVLGGNGGDARARHLRVPLDGGDAVAEEIPWTPECFTCGGSGTEMSFA
jgi:hypothetical protein